MLTYGIKKRNHSSTFFILVSYINTSQSLRNQILRETEKNLNHRIKKKSTAGQVENRLGFAVLTNQLYMCACGSVKKNM